MKPKLKVSFSQGWIYSGAMAIVASMMMCMMFPNRYFDFGDVEISCWAGIFSMGILFILFGIRFREKMITSYSSDQISAPHE